MASIMALLRFARMDIMIIPRMRVRRTASTGLIGSTVACLSAQDPGSTGFMAAAGIGAAADLDAVASDAVLQDADLASLAEADLVTAVGSRVVGASQAETAVGSPVEAVTAAGSTATAVLDSAATLEADFMAVVEVGSTAALEVGFTAVVGRMVVVVGMAADTGN
jgi:hypothetical protein